MVQINEDINLKDIVVATSASTNANYGKQNHLGGKISGSASYFVQKSRRSHFILTTYIKFILLLDFNYKEKILKGNLFVFNNIDLNLKPGKRNLSQSSSMYLYINDNEIG